MSKDYLLSEITTQFNGDENLLMQILLKLKSWHCCIYCSLRFVSLRNPDIFRNLTDDNLQDWLNKYISTKIPNSLISKCELNDNNVTNCNIKSNSLDEKLIDFSKNVSDVKNDKDNISTETDSSLNIGLQLTSSVCPTCLGLLQERYNKNTFISEIKSQIDKQNFEFSDFFCAISLPACLLIREYSFWVALCDIFPNHFKVPNFKEIMIPLKDVWKWKNGPILANALKIPFNQKSGFEIQLNFTHPNDNRECGFLFDVDPSAFKKRKRNLNGGLFNRSNVAKTLDSMNIDEFKKICKIPMDVPTAYFDCSDIICHREPTYIAGRYNKYNRNLSQTPWLIDGVKKHENSLEEMVTGVLKENYHFDQVKFSASGREDVDVRMLGRGRPFFLEVHNLKSLLLPGKVMDDLQKKINDCYPKDIFIRDLQVVDKQETYQLKVGEEEKVKKYRALIRTNREIDQSKLNKLDEIKNLTLHQKTPIRVLHRRPLAVRDRIIHEMSTKKIDKLNFILNVSTQAGTYVKEFVHGDFNRTNPNLGVLLDCECDILSLDVEEVILDWPKNLNPDELLN